MTIVALLGIAVPMAGLAMALLRFNTNGQQGFLRLEEGQLTEQESEYLEVYHKRTKEPRFEKMLEMGMRFSIMQALVNSALSLATDEFARKDDLFQKAESIGIWWAWGALGYTFMSLSSKTRLQRWLVLYICLTLVLISVLTARRFATLDAINLACSRGTTLLPVLQEACSVDPNVEALPLLITQAGITLKVVVTGLPLYCALAAVVKLQGEHALLAALSPEIAEVTAKQRTLQA